MADDVKTKKTLSDEDIVSAPHVARRSALGAIGATLLGATVLAVGLEPALAEAQSCTDNDSGPNADPGGNGRHCRRGSCTDSDPNDGAGQGRHCGGRRPSSGCTDSDPNDGVGSGRHCGRRHSQPASCTDSDGGPSADGAGHGRHCGGGSRPRPVPAGPCTDSDASPNADGVNRGRHCS